MSLFIKISLEQKPGAAEPRGPCKESRFSHVRALPTISMEVRSRWEKIPKTSNCGLLCPPTPLKKIHIEQIRNVSALTMGLQLPRIRRNFSKLCILIPSWHDYLLATFLFEEKIGRNVTRASKVCPSGVVALDTTPKEPTQPSSSSGVSTRCFLLQF